jgi:hypothetical protein
MAGYCDPPNKFSSTNQPKHHIGRRGRYLTPLLRKILEKKITFKNPGTKQMMEITVAEAIAWCLIIKALQGDIHAIKEIFDRVDGKVGQKTIDKDLQQGTKVIVFRNPGEKQV